MEFWIFGIVNEKSKLYMWKVSLECGTGHVSAIKSYSHVYALIYTLYYSLWMLFSSNFWLILSFLLIFLLKKCHSLSYFSLLLSRQSGFAYTFSVFRIATTLHVLPNFINFFIKCQNPKRPNWEIFDTFLLNLYNIWNQCFLPTRQPYEIDWNFQN